MDGPSCSLGGECAPDPITVLRRLRDEGLLARLRAESRETRSPHRRALSSERGDRGERLKAQLAESGVQVGKEAARMAADLVEAEAGAGPLFADLVDDGARRSEL